jgi:hypothetical protein
MLRLARGWRRHGHSRRTETDPIEGDPIEEIVPGFQAAEIFGGSCVPIASNQG